jgi:hypothetical protein
MYWMLKCPNRCLDFRRVRKPIVDDKGDAWQMSLELHSRNMLRVKVNHIVLGVPQRLGLIQGFTL